MNEPLISVIVPVYKVEKYLNKCIESVVNQTYKNLEIILVDDGSPDNCPQMCDEWSNKDSRIIVIHKKNGGLSDARNEGLAIANGEYIAFVDSDDWIQEVFIDKLYSLIKKYNVDIAACDVLKVYSNIELCNESNDLIKVYSTEEALETLIHGKTFRAVVWNKLYHRDLLKNEFFELNRYHEDEFFTYRILGKVDKLVYINTPLYYYLQRDGSIMSSLSIRHLDALDAHINRIRYFKGRYPKLYKTDKLIFCKLCIFLYQQTYNIDKKFQKECRKKIKYSRQNVSFSISEISEYNNKEMIYIISSRICLSFISKILYYKRIGI